MHEKITMVITTHMIHQITLEANKEKTDKVSDAEIFESFLKKWINSRIIKKLFLNIHSYYC
jgi:hypothetical protein